VGDERHAQDLAGEGFGFGGIVSQLDAAAFAAAAGVNLGFYHHRAAQPLRDGAGFFGIVSDLAARRRDAEACERLFSLIFVDFHGRLLVVSRQWPVKPRTWGDPWLCRIPRRVHCSTKPFLAYTVESGSIENPGRECKRICMSRQAYDDSPGYRKTLGTRASDAPGSARRDAVASVGLRAGRGDCFVPRCLKR